MTSATRQSAAPAHLELAGLRPEYAAQAILTAEVALEISGLCLFNPVLRAFVRHAGGELHLTGTDTHQAQLFFPWLPQGHYGFTLAWPVTLPAGEYELCISWGGTEEVRAPEGIHRFSITAGEGAMPPLQPQWQLQAETAQRIAALSWQQGMDNWFHRHFCHAAQVIGASFLTGAPQLRGRVLDIGAGDGITDLGLLLRYQPEELVAMDILDYVLALPRIAQENDLPLQSLPEGLTFVQGSCEQIPYDDASFDLVISWGSVEHIVGGYRKALDEVWRVLKPGGLFFVNPGLFYAPFGSHLGEFSSEPYLHLKISEEALRERVMSTQPRIMDRSGFDVTNADYWRFYKELNKIRVADFEQELKAYGYQVVRAALRANDMVEYTPELQPYSVIDLGLEDVFFTLQKPLG